MSHILMHPELTCKALEALICVTLWALDALICMTWLIHVLKAVIWVLNVLICVTRWALDALICLTIVSTENVYVWHGCIQSSHWQFPLKMLHPRNPRNRETQIPWYLAIQIQIEILVLNLYRGIWVARFGGFWVCRIFSGICRMTAFRTWMSHVSRVTHVNAFRTHMTAFRTWMSHVIHVSESAMSHIWNSYGIPVNDPAVSHTWAHSELRHTYIHNLDMTACPHLALDPRTAQTTARPMLVQVTGHIYEEVTGRIYEEVCI